MFSNMRWSEADTIKFIELYRQHECLWNVNSDHYRNKQIKQVAFEALIQAMGVDGFGIEEAKQKIRNLRCTYNQELLKIQRAKEMGAEPYTPGLKWFNIMDAFIRNIKGKRSTLTNLGKHDMENSITFSSLQHTNLKCEMFEEQNEYTSSFDFQSEDTPTLISCARGNRKRRFEEISETVQELCMDPQPDLDEHECDIFGRYVARALKKLPLQQQLMAQNDIMATITHHRLSALSSSPLSPLGSSA